MSFGEEELKRGGNGARNVRDNGARNVRDNGARNVRYNGARHIGILELADEYIEG